jgi:two-component sensor histidine kinase
VTVALWQPARLPQGFRELWCQELQSLQELSRLRARLRATLTGSSMVVHPEQEHWSERLVLIADELTSNALRHGGSPVAMTVSRLADRWMVAVSDSSPAVPPSPAEGRDPGLGGFGLYLVADLSAAHGFFLEPGAKSVWAIVIDDDEQTA